MDDNLYQYALDLAEQGRNYNNAFQGAGMVAAPGTSGGEGGAGSVYDPTAQLPAPGWSGPSAYNLTGAGAQYGPGSEAELSAALTRARQFDPNAHITTGVHGSGEGGGEYPYYQLNYDQSLVPAPVHPGLSAVGNYGAQDLYDRNQIYNDPNYGPMTFKQNFRPDTSFDWLGVLGPAAVGAFGFGVPMLAAGLSGGALGGAAGSFSAPWQINAGLATAKQVGGDQFNPLGLATAWAPGASGFGATPEVASALGYGAKAANAYGAWDNYQNAQQAQRSFGAQNPFGPGSSNFAAQPQGTPQTELSYDPQRYGKLNQPIRDSQINPDNQPVATSYGGDSYYGVGRGT